MWIALSVLAALALFGFWNSPPNCTRKGALLGFLTGTALVLVKRIIGNEFEWSAIPRFTIVFLLIYALYDFLAWMMRNRIANTKKDV